MLCVWRSSGCLFPLTVRWHTSLMRSVSLWITFCACPAAFHSGGCQGGVQRHLWPTLSDVPERDRAVYLDEPVSAEGLFGKSLDAIQARFETRRKQTKALRSIIPRRIAKPRPAPNVRKPMVPSPPPKKAAPSPSLGSQPVKQQPQSQPARPSAWSKGLPSGLRNDSVL